MQKRPHHAEEHENEERWLLTYADLITLLMAFFIIMYALSQVDAEKFRKMSVSLSDAFHTPRVTPLELPGYGMGGGVHHTTENSGNEKPKETQLQKLGGQLQEMIKLEGLGNSVAVISGPGGHKLTLRLADSLLFDPGSAVLTLPAKDLIGRISAIVVKAGKQVRIEGHTDNVPIHNAQYESNWQLSTARAASVILTLIEGHGIPPEMLSASGYGEYRPLAPNDTPENRARNRRVEFVITDEGESPTGEEAPPEAPPSPQPDAAPTIH